ncbi:MAG: excinuclease ABC subunit A, partial [Planctomycetes bacterium]|nr:excinuclease ABC subunit A [Planctomycetota bacterium]
MAKQAAIKIRGLRVHNLKDVDTDIPLRKFIVISGVSGSGKSSLAVDTLYAEGQRRYIETFSAYTRQFLEQLDKPEADLIASIPPAISITAKTGSKGSRSTVGTVTEINDYLRLMFAKIGKVLCQQCGQAVQRDSAETISTWIQRLPESLRFMVG